jgi:hydroxyethylthiazole kinase-like uncharacterized protein yjeF
MADAAPRPVLTTAQLREVEASAARGRSLMVLAGKAIARAARELARDTGAPILLVAGPGNNGGDAWVAAAELRSAFNRVMVLELAAVEPKAAEAREARARFAAAGGEIVHEWPNVVPSLVVDGLLGLGLTRDVEASFADVIARINAAGTPVLSIDVPSGVDADSGRVRGAAVRATRTLTFLADKPGLHTLDGPEHAGDVVLDDLGATQEVAAAARGQLLSPESARAWLPQRRPNAHKGSSGSVAIIGGSRGMVGAALLAARGALYSGAGKVFVGLLAPDAPSVDGQQPELMLRSVDDALAADVIVAGPGAGRSPSATSVSPFERGQLPAILALAKPLVLDADALNVIAFSEALRADFAARRKAPTIMTPHPAEAARLLGRETRAVQADRVGRALELAHRYGAYVVLKGAGSVCAFPDGRWSINTTGNPGLASGGTGDVLAGMIGALLAQGLAPEHALQVGVCLHGAAADALVARGIGPIGLTASELLPEVRSLLNSWASRLRYQD